MSALFSETATKFRPITSRNRFVIYYGWLIADRAGNPNEAARCIAAAQPALLIASFYTFEPKYPNLSKQVRGLLHQAGVRLFAYVDTDYGRRDRDEVKAEAYDYLNQNVDGIFFDQACNFLDGAHFAYYQDLYEYVRRYDKPVILNPGIGQPGEEIMNVTDILMVEHAWRELYQTNSWFAAYPPERFMGNSSNEHPDLPWHYQINCDIATRDTEEAWSKGIGWYFSTDNYISLPEWFSQYVSNLNYSTNNS